MHLDYLDTFNEEIAQILWKGSSRCLLQILVIHRSINVTAELYPTACRPSWQWQWSPLPCTALALSWKLLLVQATLTTTQVTCGTTGDITGGGADNTLVTGDM